MKMSFHPALLECIRKSFNLQQLPQIGRKPSMVKITETVEETPPPSKRPRRASTLPKPKEEKVRNNKVPF